MRDEGVIKFSCRHEVSNDPVPSSPAVSDLIRYRNQLYNRRLIGVYPDGIGYGNISQRLNPSSARFIISASQTGHIAELGAEGFSLVEEYSLSENWVRCRGLLKASSESLTHAMIYEIFDNAHAVIHIHDAESWPKLRDIAPTSRPDVPYGTPAMGMEVQRMARETDLRSKRILVMAGHDDGILTFGKNLDEAYTVLNDWLARAEDEPNAKTTPQFS